MVIGKVEHEFGTSELDDNLVWHGPLAEELNLRCGAKGYSPADGVRGITLLADASMLTGGLATSVYDPPAVEGLLL